MNTIDTLKKLRIDLAKLVRFVEPLEGKHWNKLGSETKAAVESARLAIEGGCPFLEYPTSANAPVVSAHKAREWLKNVEEDIHTHDTLSTDPRIEEWATLIEKLADLSKSFREDGMHDAPFKAKRLGLVRGTVNW